MDYGLCMAFTSDTSNGGATIILLFSFFMLPCSVFPPVALLHHLIYNTDSEPLACPRNIRFHISTADQISDFSRICEPLSVFYFASRNMSRKNENVLWLQKWKSRRFGRVSWTLKSHLKSWTSPKPFPSCQKPLFSKRVQMRSYWYKNFLFSFK